jgi:hypothetical protein
MGEIPVAIYFYPMFPEEWMVKPGILRIDPGTKAFDAYYVKDWLSYWPS